MESFFDPSYHEEALRETETLRAEVRRDVGMWWGYVDEAYRVWYNHGGRLSSCPGAERIRVR